MERKYPNLKTRPDIQLIPFCGSAANRRRVSIVERETELTPLETRLLEDPDTELTIEERPQLSKSRALSREAMRYRDNRKAAACPCSVREPCPDRSKPSQKPMVKAVDLIGPARVWSD